MNNLSFQTTIEEKERGQWKKYASIYGDKRLILRALRI